MEIIETVKLSNGTAQIKNNFQFVEFVKSGITNRNRIVNIFELKKSNYEETIDSYMSMFLFNETFKKHVEEKKTVRGYNGEITFNNIYVDFDCEDNIEDAKEDLIHFIQYGLGEWLSEDEFKQLGIFFSGGKGFHLAISKKFFTNIRPSLDLNKRVKAFVENVAGIVNEKNIELKTIDYKIYNKDRILRLPNTINSKTGLYKIPLSYEELCNYTIDEIKDLAKSKREIVLDKNIIPNELLTEVFNSVKIEKDYQKSKSNTGAKTNLFDPVEKGDRDETLFKLARRMLNKGLSENEALFIIDNVNQRYLPLLEEDQVNKILKSAMKYENNSKEIDRSDFMNFEDRKKNYLEYVQDTANKKIDIGFKLIDEKLRGIRPGNVLTLLAQTGIGKERNNPKHTSKIH